MTDSVGLGTASAQAPYVQGFFSVLHSARIISYLVA